jgi:membrane fusion protein (multidrug efflux system)
MIFKDRKYWSLATFAILILMAGCAGNKENAVSKQENVISVKGEQVFPISKELTKTFTGNLEGEKQADITAKISESVTKIHLNEGEFVGSNDVLISLDRSGPTSSYMQSYSVYQTAEKNYNKMKYLFDQGAVSESQFDGAKTEYEVAKANYEASLQMVDLRSPIAGMVTSIDVNPGEYVYPGMKVATVASVGKIRMKFGVSSYDIGYFKEGLPVRITVDADSVLRGEGRVLTVARSANPDTRVFQIEVELDNNARIFKPGMFGRCEIIIGQYDNVIVAPRTAILSRDGKDQVFIYSGGKVVVREVVRGVDFNGYSEIKSGLQPGDTLITVGQDYAENGGKVKLVRFVGIDGKEIEL